MNEYTRLGIELLRQAHADLRESRSILNKCSLTQNEMNLNRLAEAEGLLLNELMAFANPPISGSIFDHLNVNSINKEGRSDTWDA